MRTSRFPSRIVDADGARAKLEILSSYLTRARRDRRMRFQKASRRLFCEQAPQARRVLRDSHVKLALPSGIEWPLVANAVRRTA
jgi:hypothetical protein